MTPRGFYPSRTETIQDMELAVEARFRDGERLLASPSEAHNWGGVYLLGYVAEMILKLSYFHLKGAQPADIAMDELSMAPEEAVTLSIMKKEKDFNFHSIEHLTALVILTRIRQGRPPLKTNLHAELVSSVAIVGERWWVSMRYHDKRLPSKETKDLYLAVSWLRTYYYQLWR